MWTYLQDVFSAWLLRMDILLLLHVGAVILLAAFALQVALRSGRD